MSDPIVVSVECPHGSYRGREKVFIPCEENCEVCDGSQWFYGFLVPGSIAELEVRLGRAYEEVKRPRGDGLNHRLGRMRARRELRNALAALRKAREAADAS